MPMANIPVASPRAWPAESSNILGSQAHAIHYMQLVEPERFWHVMNCRVAAFVANGGGCCGTGCQSQACC
eukprot:3477372-Alexandrium_andersonii.AAC.1